MRILITGGSSEIGQAIAKRFARPGNEIFYTASSPKTLEVCEKAYTEAKIPARGLVLRLDRTSEPSAEATALLEKGVDALILNAASAVRKLRPFHLTSARDLEDSIDQNVLGNARLIQAVLPGMVKRKFGRLVFISSVAVAMGAPRYGVYSLTKGALEALFLNLAVDYGPCDILSNVVRPGTIRTERTRRFWSKPGYVEKLSSIIPQGRMGLPAEVAEALDPLLSETSYINGSILHVSGGFPLVRPG